MDKTQKPSDSEVYCWIWGGGGWFWGLMQQSLVQSHQAGSEPYVKICTETKTEPERRRVLVTSAVPEKGQIAKC
jgi:hypothetical protein